MTKLVSFDLEIAKELPDKQCSSCLSENIAISGKEAMCGNCGKIGSIYDFRSDWKNHRPLGITCAASAYQRATGIEYFYWHMPDRINQKTAQSMVKDLQRMTNDEGFSIVGWNSCAFDFDVLAEESGLYNECAELALNHIDLMFVVTTLRGHWLGLDKAAKGANIQGKLKSVMLSNGQILNDMSGGKAPALWKAGEYQAVLDYLADDVRSTLELAQWIETNKKIQWTSDKGYHQEFDVPKLYTVRECLELSRDTVPKWVTEPIKLKSMMEWIK